MFDYEIMEVIGTVCILAISLMAADLLKSALKKAWTSICKAVYRSYIRANGISRKEEE